MRRPKKLPRVDHRVIDPPPRAHLRSSFFVYPDTKPSPQARCVSRVHMSLAISGYATAAWVVSAARVSHPGYVGDAAIRIDYAFEDREGLVRTGFCVTSAYADGERGSTARGCLSGKKKAFTILYDDENDTPVWWLFS